MTQNNNSLPIIAIAIMNETGAPCLDANNICWKFVNGEIIGKRTVWTKDNRACWLENTTIENVEKWWCGEDADYEEIFYY